MNFGIPECGDMNHLGIKPEIGLHQLFLQGLSHGCRAGMDLKFFVDFPDVGINGIGGNEALISNHFIAEALNKAS